MTNDNTPSFAVMLFEAFNPEHTKRMLDSLPDIVPSFTAEQLEAMQAEEDV